MDKIRLNNFILWCKNWYQPIDKKMSIIKQAKRILFLDGYTIHNNPIPIVLLFIDELVENGIIRPIKLQVWNEDIIRNMATFNISYKEALFYRIKTFFAVECKSLPLTPPVYSREVYKLGFVGPRYMGNSYKMLNYKARKFFNPTIQCIHIQRKNRIANRYNQS